MSTYARRTALLLCALAALFLSHAPASAETAADPPKGETDKAEGNEEAPAKKSATKKRRGGIHPCATPDPGFGIYDNWTGGLTMGQALIPHKGGLTKSGGFDVVIHFHGHEAVRKEFVKTAKGTVLVGIDLGIGSGAYAAAFNNPSAFPNLVASIEAAVAKHHKVKKAKVRKLALSSWSAGYGATEQILRQTGGKKIDTVILLDSLHAGYQDENQKAVKGAQLEPFLQFARGATKKQRLFYLSHSAIQPPGYASTTEVAHYLIGKLGVKKRISTRKDILGLDMVERSDKAGFHMRGYTGEDKPDHCAHIGLMADVMKVHILPRWKTPKGKGPPS